MAMPPVKRRYEFGPDHPVFGGVAALRDDDVLEPGDETACASVLLAGYGGWTPCGAGEWGADFGRRIADVCDSTGDMDGAERLFRRPGK